MSSILKSIKYNILYLFTSLIGGCWCSNKNITITREPGLEKKEVKNNLRQDFKNIFNKKDRKNSSNDRHNGEPADNHSQGNSENNTNNNNNTQSQKTSQDSNLRNDTLSKESLANNDKHKESSEQKKNLLNNASPLNDVKPTNNNNEETANGSNSWQNNSNSVDGTFLEENIQNTTFPIQPPTNPNYNPNGEAKPANTLTKNSTDQQDGNSIPITNSLKIIFPDNSKDEDSRTNEHPSQKEASKSNTIITINVNNEKEEQINALGNEKTNNENEKIVPSAPPREIYPNLSDEIS